MEINILASGSAGNCYYISDGVTPLLIECGIPWHTIQRKLNFETSKIAACLISHEHQDHAKSWLDVSLSGIDVYISQGTGEKLNITPGHRLHRLAHSHEDVVGSWVVLPFEVEHDAAEPLGFLLTSFETSERLMYATDTAYLKYRFTDLTHIMVECNYSLDLLRDSVSTGAVNRAVKRRIMESHFSLENVITMLKANNLSKCQAVYLLHLSENNADREMFKKAIQEATGKVVIL
jgi:phosphoribosyl 1,2-cyclic phosphodiesterase